jgi:hypothetical protein
MSCELGMVSRKGAKEAKPQRKMSLLLGVIDYKALRLVFNLAPLRERPLQPCYQFLVSVSMNRFYQVISNPVIRARFLHIIPVNR